MKPEMDPKKLRMMEACAREIAESIAFACQTYSAHSGGEKWGFALMIFSFDKGPELTWISNADREDMIKMMQEFINANPPNQTSADRN